MLDSLMRRFSWWRQWRGLSNPAPDAITRHALRIAHESAEWIKEVRRKEVSNG